MLMMGSAAEAFTLPHLLKKPIDFIEYETRLYVAVICLLISSHWMNYSTLSIMHCSAARVIVRNAGLVDHDFCNLVHIIGRFPFPDYRISVSYDRRIPTLMISHDPEVFCQLLTYTKSTHSSCIASTEFLIAYCSFNIFLLFAAKGPAFTPINCYRPDQCF